MPETEDIVTRLRLMSRLGYWPLLGDEAADTIATLRAEVEGLRADAERYRWLANRVLACDYGDNDAPGEQIGWRIRHDLLAQHGKRQPAFMYGASINAAIDAAKADKEGA